MQRRAFLTTAAAAAAATAIAPAGADPLPLGNLPDTRYPDTRVEAIDKRFKYKVGGTAIERIASGHRFTEGQHISAMATISCGAISRTTG
jgi:gluconolactonase